MRFFRRLMAAACAIMLLAPALCLARAEGERYIGSRPVAAVYVTQTRKHTCTLVATTMMLRNYASLRGAPCGVVDAAALSKFCWTKRWGLAQHFIVGQVEVSSNADIRKAPDKKQYLIEQLQLHPEGIVIYDTGMPHAIYLFGYDPDSDIFYCADTVNSRGGRPIRLEQSIIRGETQADKIKTIDKIWFVVDKSAQREALEA